MSRQTLCYMPYCENPPTHTSYMWLCCVPYRKVEIKVCEEHSNSGGGYCTGRTNLPKQMEPTQ